ncbi:glycosyl transferase [Bacteroidia bacterium]|nr:glycosyl transferase [Bacteroidia bacterium]GHV70725.1 glycosyl transferase [Bacteroidia bacterium]
MDSTILSVCLITYNHVNYIQQSIEGILMQKVNFRWKLIIADDFSTDGTREVIQEYKNKYPDFLTLILQKRNVGALKNWIDLISYPQSKYIVYFEGDDYWTDPHKLQKQVDFLEANPEYSLCTHLYKTYDDATQIWTEDPKHVLFKDEHTAGITFGNDTNFSTTWFTQTMTIVFRRDAIDLSILNRYKYTRDVHLYYHLLKAGKGYCLNFEGAVYRFHEGGIYSKTSLNSKNFINYKIFSELYSFNPDDGMLKNNYLFLRKLVLDAIRDAIHDRQFSKDVSNKLSFFIKNEYKINGIKSVVYYLPRIIFSIFAPRKK